MNVFYFLLSGGLKVGYIYLIRATADINAWGKCPKLSVK